MPWKPNQMPNSRKSFRLCICSRKKLLVNGKGTFFWHTTEQDFEATVMCLYHRLPAPPRPPPPPPPPPPATTSGVPRGAWVFNPPPPKFRRHSKILPNSTRLWKLLKIDVFRKTTHQDVRKKGSKILKLPPVRNCFTFAMTNKLVVIINNFKVPKIKKILLYELKFLVPNYSCLQNPWLGGYSPQIPVLSVFCPQLNLLNPPARTKFLGTPLTTTITTKPSSPFRSVP